MKKIKKGMLLKFKKGEVLVNFINGSGSDCELLRNLLKKAAPNDKKDMPAYSFDNYYYIDGENWYGSSWRSSNSFPIKNFYWGYKL